MSCSARSTLGLLSLALAVVLPASLLPTDPSTAAGTSHTSGPAPARAFAHLTWATPVLALPGAKLDSLSCGTAASCVAIDGTGPGHVQWNGRAWSSPDFTYRGTDVSCASATFCLAVGSLTGGPESFVWNGHAWSTGTPVTPQQVYPSSVSCTAPTSCTAVDESGNAYRWDGSAWAQQTVAPGSQLTQVSCVPGFCLAVDDTSHAFAWTGGSWSPVAPVPSPVEPESLSCASASLCALGSFEGSVTMWEGAGWTTPQRVDDVVDADLRGMSCPSVTFCMAVDFGGRQMLWNGSRWSAPAYLDLPYGGSLNPTSLSCTTTFCAVGDEGGTIATTTRVTQPARHTSYHYRTRGELRGVASVSRHDAWAVGEHGSPGSPQPLAVHWDGSRWSRAAVPTPATGMLLGVAAVSPRRAWAVGWTGTTTKPDTLVEAWTGQAWLPQGSALPGQLAGVAAVSARNAWAVGSTRRGHLLVLHWDGQEWTRQHVAGRGTLAAVAARSGRDAWAVGTTRRGRAQAWHWNGHHWRQVPTPHPGRRSALAEYLDGVAFGRGGTVWAVGDLSCGCGPGESLVLRWHGHHWRRVPSPTTHGGTNLFGVATVGRRLAWSVGDAGSGDGPTRTTVLRSRGHRWRVVPSPSPGTSPVLYGVTAARASYAWSVGATACRADACRTLVLHWNGHRWR